MVGEMGGEARVRIGSRIVAAGALCVVALVMAAGPAGGEVAARVACTITGSGGDDRLVGTDGDDVICGLGGDDELIGREGDDVLIGGRGSDDLLGGRGADRLLGGAGSDEIAAGTGDDIVRAGKGGLDHGHGGSGDDRVFGGPGRDALVDFVGRNRLRGGGGPDVVTANGFHDLVWGGAGDDPCLSTFDQRGGDVIDGGTGHDTYHADPGDLVTNAERPAACDSDAPES